MDFDPLDGLLDRDVSTESSNQCETLNSSAPRSISSGYGDSAPWPSEPLHVAQRTMQQNAQPDLRNEVGEISPATTEQLYVFYLRSPLVSYFSRFPVFITIST